jgi:hypothetical protein
VTSPNERRQVVAVLFLLAAIGFVATYGALRVKRFVTQAHLQLGEGIVGAVTTFGNMLVLQAERVDTTATLRKGSELTHEGAFLATLFRVWRIGPDTERSANAAGFPQRLLDLFARTDSSMVLFAQFGDSARAAALGRSIARYPGPLDLTRPLRLELAPGTDRPAGVPYVYVLLGTGALLPAFERPRDLRGAAAPAPTGGPSRRPPATPADGR